MDVGAEAGIHSVEMAAPADRRNGLVVGKIARKQCRQHAVFGNLNVDEAEFGKFFGEHAGELALGREAAVLIPEEIMSQCGY